MSSTLKTDSSLGGQSVITEVGEHASNDGSEIQYDAEVRKSRYEKKKSISDIITIICAGAALMSDGYQNNLMTMLNALFVEVYGKKVYNATVKTRVSNASIIGTILGQLSIGLTCDYYGRKWAIVFTTVFIVIGSALCAGSYGTSVEGMFWMLTVCRGVIGWGVGGEYSACSSASSESANEMVKRRGGAFIMVTNFPLSLGGPFAIIVFLIVLSACGMNHLKAVWRICFGLGIIWPLCIFYFRYKMVTSKMYKQSAIKKNVPYFLVFKFYWRRLLGTCGCWFIYDFITFPNGVFSSTITASVLHGKGSLKEIGEWTLLLGIIALPGVFIGAYFVDKWGRRNCLMTGFAGYLVIGLIIGLGYDKLKKITALFIVLYGLFNSFGNFGPGNNMGLTSAECYATPVRGTLYGLSAAFGKAGAAIGTQVFTSIQDNLGKKWTFIISAILGIVGVTLAYFTIPNLKQDDLLMEDIRFEKYLRDNGWTGHFGLDDDTSTTESESVEQVEYDVEEFGKK